MVVGFGRGIDGHVREVLAHDRYCLTKLGSVFSATTSFIHGGEAGEKDLVTPGVETSFGGWQRVR